MIDVHSHILWGVDDGADTREQSLAMLRMAAEFGTTDIVASPHSDLTFTYAPDVIDARIADLSREPGIPRIHRGCDFHMSIENIEKALKDHTPFTINGRNHLLVEFADMLIPNTTEQILSEFIARGIVPVITHPERNPILQMNVPRLQGWIDMGCLVQVTAQSLTDRFGKAAEKTAWKLLRAGMVHVLASDAHDTKHRPPRLDLAYETASAKLGADAARMLLEENPAAIIAGAKVSGPAIPASNGAKWFQFWK